VVRGTWYVVMAWPTLYESCPSMRCQASMKAQWARFAWEHLGVFGNDGFLNFEIFVFKIIFFYNFIFFYILILKIIFKNKLILF